MLRRMSDADNPDRLPAIPGDPATTDAKPSSTGETAAPPEIALVPTSEDAPEAAPESRARMERWDHGPPWEWAWFQWMFAVRRRRLLRV
jgi:hypothetical protein